MSQLKIPIYEIFGAFAENKDRAKKVRIESIMPTLSRGEEVVLDFARVDGATQSLVHALVADPIRQLGDVALENLIYTHANEDIQEIISIVYRYMQESIEG